MGGVFHFVRAAAGEGEITPERNAVRRQRRSSLHWPDKRADRLAFLLSQKKLFDGMCSGLPTEGSEHTNHDPRYP